MPFKHISVESPKTYVDPHSLGSGSPKSFLFVATDIRTVGQYRRRNNMPISYICLFTNHSVVVWNNRGAQKFTIILIDRYLRMSYMR